MAFSLNKIMLIGNLGADAETRFSTNNVGITTYSIATTHSYKGKDGNWINETTWHNVVSFNLSDFFKDALKKGKKVYVEGRLSKRDYNDKEGIRRFVTEVVSDKIILLDARESSGYDSPRPVQNSAPEPTGSSSVEDDDLPF